MPLSLYQVAQSQMAALPEPRSGFAQHRACTRCHQVRGEHDEDCPNHPANVRREAVREEFALALQGNLGAPALFAQKHTWLANATVADVLADALCDREALLRRAMVVLANAAAGRGTQRDAQQLLDEAVRRWVGSWE